MTQSSEFEIFDNPGEQLEDRFVILKLHWETDEGEIGWDNRWPHQLGFIQRSLKEYMDKYCPAPQEIWSTFLDSLPPEIRKMFEGEA